ncbi:MAG: FtsL-like putative cell division protein [Candidatus Azobacteroides sp.]|nr:FtsL-like putative cell division protein [Candidatus Azobacteroides sp.]
MESENKNEEPKVKSGKKKKKLSYFFGGSILTEDFVIKQSKLFFLIFCLILLFISNRYYCAKKLSEMDMLKKELIDLNYEQVFLTTRLTAITRQSQIEELLREKGIELTKSNTTVYQIRK